MKYQPDTTPDKAVASLKSALAAAEAAEHCAVLWFADIMKRKLYRHFGYSTMNQFAELELQFSRTRTGDFIRLASKLVTLPVVRDSLTEGQLGYTKALEILQVATPRTQKAWVEEAAKSSRMTLRAKVKKAKDAARRRRKGATVQPTLAGLKDVDLEVLTSQNTTTRGDGQATASGGDAASPTPRRTHSSVLPDPLPEVPVRVSVEMMPDQFARYEALLDLLRLQGRSTTYANRAELVLAGLESLQTNGAIDCDKKDCEESTRRRAPDGTLMAADHGEASQTAASAPANGKKKSRLRSAHSSVQIHVHHCPACSQSTVTTGRGELAISRQTFLRLAGDARIDSPGLPNKATIPPRKRLTVLNRDRHRCQAPGCRHTHNLHIHHILPRHKGGSNKLENLITLCAGCHRIWHERGGPPAGWVRTAAAQEEAVSATSITRNDPATTSPDSGSKESPRD